MSKFNLLDEAKLMPLLGEINCLYVTVKPDSLAGCHSHGHPGTYTHGQPLAQPKVRSGTQGELGGSGKGEQCKVRM